MSADMRESLTCSDDTMLIGSMRALSLSSEEDMMIDFKDDTQARTRSVCARSMRQR